MQLDRRFMLMRGLSVGLGWPLLGDALRAQEPAAGNDRRSQHFFDEPTRKAVADGLAYLAERQSDDGSFGSGTYRSNLAVCGLCGMAFLSSGFLPGRGKYGKNLNRCVDFVLANSQDSGLIHSDENKTRGPMYEHGFATLFLAEVYGNSWHADLRRKLTRAVQLIVNTQNDEGGWRYEARRDEADLSVTVCEVMALRAAHNAGVFVPKETIDRAVAYVKRCQNPDGGFMYMLSSPGDSRFPRSAAAIVALNSAGIYDEPAIERGLAYLMRTEVADSSYYFYGQYYAVQAMWHARGRFWETWYPAIRDKLLGSQQPGGSWADAISAEFGTAVACLILRMPENYLPIFER
jgi:hypothetical protein